MWNKLLHHLLQGVLVIHDHLAQPGVLPVTNTHTRNTIVTIETITHMDGSENFSIASVCLWRSVTWLHVSSRGRSCKVL